MKNNSLGVLYASFTASLWGFLAIALKVAVTDLSPTTVVWFRFGIAFCILAILTLIFKRSDYTIFKKPPWKLILAAFFLGLNYVGFISGIKYVSPSASQVFIMIGPVTFAMSGIVIFKEKVNWRHFVGFAMVLGGIGLFYSEQIATLAGAGHRYTLGMLLIVGGGLSWTVFSSLQKSLVQKYRPNQLNLFIYAFCTVLLLPFVQYEKLSGLSGGDIGLLIYLGANTVLAYGSLALAIKYTRATTVSVIITLNPIITFASMYILGRMNVSWIAPETLSFMSIVGAGIVLLGALVVILAGRVKKVDLA